MSERKNKSFVKVYHGYGHTHDLVVFGTVFHFKPFSIQHYTTNVFVNVIRLLKLFFVDPVAHARVRLNWQEQRLDGRAEEDGFVKFEWQSAKEIDAGWHDVEIDHLDDAGHILTSSPGKIYVPHSTQFVFISDIDDTILRSYSATIMRRLRELFTRNPRTRVIFTDVMKHYQMLAKIKTTEATPNPFFYVSSSEWNLYDYLLEFFRYNQLPEGTFLLNQVKRWYELWKTGKTKHQGKLLRISRIFETFPIQKFVLLGDNSQADPFIYEALTRKYPGRVQAIYIRNVHEKNLEATRKVLSQTESKGVHVCIFKHSNEAIEHSKNIFA
jgi:phosphatidate phosphatase APP1